VQLLWLWLPVALDAALIFFLSSIPQLPSPPGPFSDKHIHFGWYAVFTVLIVRALASGRLRNVTGRVAIAAILLAAFYGLTDEIHQSFVPGRSADPHDLLADTAGAIAAAGLLLAWAIIRRRRQVAEKRLT
jgi:VanZ family protein